MNYDHIDTSLIDQLLVLIGDDKGALHELIETFLEEGAEIVSQSQLATENQDLDLLRRSAHSLKSSAQDFGARDLSQHCASLESACKHNWPEDATGQVRLIDQTFKSASGELQHYLQQHG